MRTADRIQRIRDKVERLGPNSRLAVYVSADLEFLESSSVTTPESAFIARYGKSALYFGRGREELRSYWQTGDNAALERAYFKFALACRHLDFNSELDYIQLQRLAALLTAYSDAHGHQPWRELAALASLGSIIGVFASWLPDLISEAHVTDAQRGVLSAILNLAQSPRLLADAALCETYHHLSVVWPFMEDRDLAISEMKAILRDAVLAAVRGVQSWSSWNSARTSMRTPIPTW